jgi:hypothetical protein
VLDFAEFSLAKFEKDNKELFERLDEILAFRASMEEEVDN